MSVGVALKEARLAKGLTQGNLARELYVSDSLVSEWERGRSRIPGHMARRVARRLPRSRVILELAHQLLGKAFVSPVLNRVDRHLACMVGKTDEELREILDRSAAVRRIIFSGKGPGMLTPDERKAMWDWAQELLDGRTAADNTLAEICDWCSFDPEEMFGAHWAKLEAKGYYDPGR